jgi:hypothetical protein
MSEAQVAVTGGWTEQSFGRDRAKPRSAPRSLGAALRDAGLSDAAPDPRKSGDDASETVSLRAPASRLSSAIAASRSPSLAVFDEPEAAPSPATVKPASQPSVVSPPPWLRAARRGRRHARMLNTFGWVMTLVVAGSIIGLAGRFLAVSPVGIATTMQARQ